MKTQSLVGFCGFGLPSLAFRALGCRKGAAPRGFGCKDVLGGVAQRNVTATKPRKMAKSPSKMGIEVSSSSGSLNRNSSPIVFISLNLKMPLA